MRLVVLLISALLWVSAPSRAFAAYVFDFEDIGGDACFSFVSDPISTQGFLLTDEIPGSNFFTCNGASDPRDFATNGTRTLVTRNVVITHAAGAPFDLLSFDLGETAAAIYWPSPHVWVLGRTWSGGVVAADFIADGLLDGIDGIADFETFYLGEEFSDLVSVQIIDPSRESFFLDNISIFVLPEHDDPDGDGVRSWQDNCPAIANPDQSDMDGDGIGDACNSDQDVDGDEWADHLDNCMWVANPDQVDAELDGWGDACDNCPLTENPEQADDNPSNGVGDACEDTDGDGLTNLDELNLYSSDPWNPDTDGDGLGDGDEVSLFGSDPLEIDTDGDGVYDGEEVSLFGTNPIEFDPAWILSGTLDTRMGGQSERLTVTGKLLISSARTYVIQVDGELLQERGVWFQQKGKLLLYPQNLLEMVQTLEQELGAGEGGPIELSVLSIRTEGSWDSRTGGLLLKADTRCNASFQQSNLTGQLSRSLKVTGMMNSAAGGMVQRSDAAMSSTAGDIAISDAPLGSSALADVPVSVWDLTGTATGRVGRNTESSPVSATLTLNGDRTYVLGPEDDPLPETGVWFQDRNRLLLYQQNFLEQVIELEERLAGELQEPVEVHLTRFVNKASIKGRTGVLSLKSDAKFDIVLPISGLWAPYSYSMKAEGTRRGLPR